MCSGALKKPIQSQMVVLGSMSIGGTITKVDELASILQVCFDAGVVESPFEIPMFCFSKTSSLNKYIFMNLVK
ncbi:hypothetical protein CLTEP_16640 [Clostridium tepidiprofundi DSM 19306]|uniref:Uncharacterized protein n=1 Tax=Clostridium tepidiprofundi DSM 19306 TaxID=1121338 RepID=A0A151B3E6_9CLOT|nr:hypothetical protein [Clostridium tepidiprofundi]KYH34431.1 hypothetical protein CLTEP_16640 [Clostridium tepidiprofundi DSM 19306]